MSKIKVDKKASDELKNVLSEMGIEAKVIRIFISGMACHGPMFNITKDEIKENDESFEFEGITYVVENNLVEEFGGFTLEYIEDGNYHGLYVKPDIMPDLGGSCSSCSGCGH